ncbi:MAG: AAA family ATPase [Vicinamibacterales bacterium]
MSDRDQAERREAALLDVVRLALNGDHRSLRQRARNLLRAGDHPVLSDEGRRILQGFLAAGGDLEPSRTSRRPRSNPIGPGAELIADTADEAPPPVLDPQADEGVRRLIREYEQRHLLEEANLAPTTRVLLSGPPGGGKTMTARYIAHRLGVPLLLAEPSQVLTGVMGESARNISGLMRNAAAQPCVLFLDELDVYARRRGETHDIAEPKRLVNTLLLELDRWPEHGLIIAATNHPDVLDEAVSRRFELTIELCHPGEQARRSIIAGVLNRAARECPSELLDAVARVSDGQSGSDLVNNAIAAVRRSIIDAVPIADAIGHQFVSARFIGRGKDASELRRQVARQLSDAGWNVERIAAVVDVQAPTAVRMLTTEQ